MCPPIIIAAIIAGAAGIASAAVTAGVSAANTGAQIDHAKKQEEIKAKAEEEARKKEEAIRQEKLASEAREKRIQMQMMQAGTLSKLAMEHSQTGAQNMIKAFGASVETNNQQTLYSAQSQTAASLGLEAPSAPTTNSYKDAVADNERWTQRSNKDAQATQDYVKQMQDLYS